MYRTILYKLSFLFIFIFLNSTNTLEAQKAHVNNPAFAAKINSMIHHTVDLIDVDQLQSEYDKYYIIDTRKKEEYDLSHLPNAALYYYKIDDKSLEQIPKDKPIVVYCSIGVRSELLGERLKKKGYTVYNLYGGLFEWANRDNQVVFCDKNNQEQVTNTIHQYNFVWGKWMDNKNYKKKGMIIL